MSAVKHLPFQPDKKITEVFRHNPFMLSAEVIPPRNGTEQPKVMNQIGRLIKAGSQFLSVTKGAGGSLRGGTLPIAQAIKEQFGVPCIAHFTCRDLIAAEIENQLIDHHYFGIRNVLALRGDPPEGQPMWTVREGGYNYAYQLIEQIRKLNRGEYQRRPNAPVGEAQGGHEKTDFCIGAAAYPEFPDETNRIEYFRKKIEAGATYGITDMLFDPEAYARFVDQCAKKGVLVPVLPGTRVLKSREQALKMMARFKVSVPKKTLEALPEKDGPDSIARGVEQFVAYSERLKVLGAPGVHLFVIGDADAACEALTSLAWGQKKVKYSAIAEVME
jgi:methylenetetrahydrofolate reductase (NADPH)